MDALADAARQLAGHAGIEEVAAIGCRLATSLVPGTRRAGVVRLLSGGRSTTIATSESAVDRREPGAAEEDWIALPLECDADALVLYLSGSPLGSAGRGIAALLAAELSIAVQATHNGNRAANLERALQTSRDIGVAMGIVMARRACTREQAFDLLRRASRARQRKLAAIAAEVAEQGILEFELGTRGPATGRLA